MAPPWPRRTGNWHTLAAVEDKSQAPAQLQLFWDRFRVLRPNHQIFDLERSHGVTLSRTVPVMVHGDEGRSKKRLPVMCLSCHSALGLGVTTRKKRSFEAMQGEQQMNYTGLSHCNRFLLAVLPKNYYEQPSKTFHNLMEFLARDIEYLSKEGVCGPDNLQYHVATISIKGDWPFLHKVAGLRRSFYNQPKQAQSKKPCGGICHLCQAGQPLIPFEDLTQSCEWQYTMGIDPPWAQRPIVLDHLTHDPTFPEIFFHPDPWHSFHLGEGRNLVCNVIKLLLEITPGRNVDERLELLFDSYKRFCARARTQAYCVKFSENLFGLKASDYPSGSWTKGNFTTSLVKWLAVYLHQERNNFQPGSLLVKAVP